MPLGSIRNAYDVYQQHDFSREFQFRIINIFGAPQYVVRELVEKPAGEGGVLYLQSASVPGRTVTDVPVTYQGFTFHVPGSVAYNDNPWSLTFKTPGDYLVRNALEAWHFELFSDETSCGNFKIPCQNTIIRLGLTDANCRIIRVYDLVGVYPQNLGPIQYNIEGTNFTTFEVAFHYQYWRLRPANDSGLVDSTTTEESVIRSTYSGYHSTIIETDTSCDNIPSF